MSLYIRPPRSGQRDKLGLALAGGGFRASLFHLGVLRRMAEMDILRYVEVLSTVSGGSIIGALYVLMLKERIDRQARLSRKDYMDLIACLKETFVAGVQKDLRTRLFMNPLGMLRVLLSQDGLSRRMGRIYDRYLYCNIVDALRARGSVSRKPERLAGGCGLDGFRYVACASGLGTKKFRMDLRTTTEKCSPPSRPDQPFPISS